MSSNLSNVEILNILLEGKDLDNLTSRTLMQRWLNDEISDVQTGAFLSALRAKGCSGVELCSMAQELLNVCKLPIERPNLYLVDTCGTGGDGANTFNSALAIEHNSTPVHPLALKALKKAPVCTSDISSLSHLCINDVEVKSSRFLPFNKLFKISTFDKFEDIYLFIY